jgi:hypothetical protein
VNILFGSGAGGSQHRRGLLRGGVRLIAALALPLAAGCGDGRLQKQLASGRAAAEPCNGQLHDSAEEFRDCIRLRAASGAPAERLGALFYGWVMADSAVMFSVDGAEPIARELARDAATLQRQLGIPDPVLCATVQADCRRLQARREAALK